MIYHRRRLLGEMFGMAGELRYCCVVGESKAAIRMVKAAKLEGDKRTIAKLRHMYHVYLDRYFGDFAVAVPRGRGRNSLMLKLLGDHPRFVACFDHITPHGVKHHPIARMGHYPEPEVKVDVAGQFVVLCDDLVTTGTTLVMHLGALVRAGAFPTALVLAGR